MIATALEDEHPLLPVTVTEYVFGLVKVFEADAVLLPPDQEYVPPPEAVTLIDVVSQFNNVVPVLLLMLTVGVVIS